MAVFTRSIRWRLLFWLAFLLVGLVSGFGVTVYQLHRINRLAQFDDEAKRRLAALSADFRGRAGSRPDDAPPSERGERVAFGSGRDHPGSPPRPGGGRPE